MTLTIAVLAVVCISLLYVAFSTSAPPARVPVRLTRRDRTLN